MPVENRGSEGYKVHPPKNLYLSPRLLERCYTDLADLVDCFTRCGIITTPIVADLSSCAFNFICDLLIIAWFQVGPSLAFNCVSVQVCTPMREGPGGLRLYTFM